jgi:hypothetical protein
MLKAHPITGVGLDRFGTYFGQYRDATQVLRRGPNIVSNAAHNVWIQLAATGGLLLLLSYLALMVFVGWRAGVALKSNSGNKQIVVATVVGLWLTYQAQAFISIDNIGIAVWGWLFGGMIVAISLSDIPVVVNAPAPTANKGPRIKNQSKSGKDNYVVNLVTAVLVIVTLFGVSLLARGDVGMQNLNKVGAPKNASEYAVYQQFADTELSKHPVDPFFVESVASQLNQIGMNFASSNQVATSITAFAKADGLVANLIKEDKRDINAFQIRSQIQNSLSQIYTAQKDPAKAKSAMDISIASLKQMCELDPLNSGFWLQLGKAYKASGDMASAKSVIAKIAAFDPKEADLASAKKELGA